MFGIKTFDPWIGKSYARSYPKLLILGESRYDDDYSDRNIVESLIKGDRSHTYTNFLQAVLAKRYWEEGYDPSAFWDRTIFYNYLTNFFPGEPRVYPQWEERENLQNRQMLRRMLQKHKPTHCIVWGYANWEGIGVEDFDWGPEWPIPGLADDHTYCSITVDGNTTLFSYVRHPSAGFSHDRWSAVISAFLMLKP